MWTLQQRHDEQQPTGESFPLVPSQPTQGEEGVAQQPLSADQELTMQSIIADHLGLIVVMPQLIMAEKWKLLLREGFDPVALLARFCAQEDGSTLCGEQLWIFLKEKCSLKRDDGRISVDLLAAMLYDLAHPQLVWQQLAKLNGLFAAQCPVGGSGSGSLVSDVFRQGVSADSKEAAFRKYHDRLQFQEEQKRLRELGFRIRIEPSFSRKYSRVLVYLDKADGSSPCCISFVCDLERRSVTLHWSLEIARPTELPQSELCSLEQLPERVGHWLGLIIKALSA